MLDDFYLEPKTQKFYIATMPEYILNADNIWDLGPVVQSWVSANPGLTFYSILVCVFLNVCSFQNFRKQNSNCSKRDFRRNTFKFINKLLGRLL